MGPLGTLIPPLVTHSPFSVPLRGPLLPHCQPPAGSVGSESGVCSLSTYQLVKEFGTLSGLSEVLSKGPQMIRHSQVTQHILSTGRSWEISDRGHLGCSQAVAGRGAGGNPGWPWNPRVSGQLWAASRPLPEVISEVFRAMSLSSVMANLSWPK